MPLSRLAAAITAAPAASELVPPPRFAAKRFDTYVLDPAVDGQREAVLAVRRFATLRPGLIGRLLHRGRPGLYLDGGFGAGKTHLLAACFHAARGSRRYLSFSEAMSLMTVLGAHAAVDLLRADLVCIDEFELDDPANTRLADLLVRSLVERGCRIATTSNTVPGELGAGRMAVDLFRNELARIEHAFADLHLPGADHRRRGLGAGDPPGWGPDASPLPAAAGRHVVDAQALDRSLVSVPVASLRRLAALLDGLTITGLRPFTDQLSALRFVHLVDRLYDWQVPLRVQARCPLADLFPPEHCLAAFAKKYRRCQSRLAELCNEGASAPAATP